MKRCVTIITGLVAILMLSGCIPEQRIIWSPDGRQAVVLADEGAMYLCDAEGALSEQKLDGVFRVAWFGDSVGLVLARVVEFSSWEQVHDLLAPSEREELVALAEKFYGVYLENKDFATAVEAVLAPVNLSDNQNGLVGLYLKEHYPDLVEEDLPESVEVMLIETAEVGNGTFQLKHRVAAMPSPVWDLRIAPNDLWVAYTSGEPFEDNAASPSLYLSTLNETPVVRRIARNVALFTDWSADGQYLVYAAASSNVDMDELQLGSICRRKVADESGSLLEEVGEREDLAGIIMNGLTRVRTLPDGSIVFTAMEVQLPATAGDLPENMNLFKINPETQATVSRLLPRTVESCLGEWSMLFELSPDGRKIAFLDAEGRAAVATIATGELLHVPDSESESVLPGWRGNDELLSICKLADEDGTERTVVVLFSDKRDPKTIEISADWPTEVLEFLDD